MTQSVTDRHKRLADVLFAIGRGILFFWCFMLCFGSIGWFFLPHQIVQQHNITGIDAPEKDLGGYLMTGVALVASLLGLYGTSKRNSRSLKLFALILTIFALNSATAAYNEYTDQKTSLSKFGAVLARAELEYVWYQTDANTPTSLWDAVQELYKCCGLEGRSGWNYLRPYHLASDVLPASCCSSLSRAFSSDGRCHFEDAYKASCLAEYATSKSTILIWLSVDIICNMTLAFLALSIAILGNKNNTAQAQHSSSTTTSGKTGHPEDVVYVVHPGKDQSQQQLDHKPPAYLMVASAPLPSYPVLE